MPTQDVTPTAAEVRDRLQLVVARFDPSLVTATQAAEAVAVFAEIERLAQAGRLLAAGRVAETSVWAGGGDRTAAAWLARTTGQSTSDAQKDLAAARALDQLDDTRDAFRRGELTKEQVREIAPAAAQAPTQEDELLREARHGSVERLRGKARAARAGARHDGREAVERMRRRRSFRHGPAEDGGHWFRGYAPPEEMARLLAGMGPHDKEARRAARRRKEPITDEQAAFDALLALVAAGSQPLAGGRGADGGAPHGTETDRGGAGDAIREPRGTEADPAIDRDATEETGEEPLVDASAQPRGPEDASTTRPRWATKVIVNVDLAALRRGYTVPGERCEITGIGPVPVATVDDLLARDDTFLTAVLREDGDIRTVVHLGRAPTAKQRTALEADHTACCIDGCPDPPAVIDHHDPFAHDGPRTLANLGPLCEDHDRRKTYEGWVLVKDGRSRRLVPPSHELARGAIPGGCIDLEAGRARRPPAARQDSRPSSRAASVRPAADRSSTHEQRAASTSPSTARQLDLLAG